MRKSIIVIFYKKAARWILKLCKKERSWRRTYTQKATILSTTNSTKCLL